MLIYRFYVWDFETSSYQKQWNHGWDDCLCLTLIIFSASVFQETSSPIIPFTEEDKHAQDSCQIWQIISVCTEGKAIQKISV